MNRRIAIRNMALILGSAAVLPSCLSDKGKPVVQLKHLKIDADQEKLVNNLAETILPKTDTPGEMDLGINLFVFKMIDDCYDKEHQADFIAGLSDFAAEAKKQLDYWFDRLEIQGWWNKKIQELSKGMAQKIQFVVTVLHKPKLLIFDEPFSGFDPVNANLIKDEILELKKQGSTIIFSTHRMESVEELCDDIALIHKSNKLIEGKLIDVKKDYRSNTFEIGIMSSNVEGLMYQLTQKFTVGQANFKSLNDDLKLEIQIGNSTPNELLNILTQNGQVTHFVEKIPSVNDIFIQTVSK